MWMDERGDRWGGWQREESISRWGRWWREGSIRDGWEREVLVDR
jgi:hypothetical protein